MNHKYFNYAAALLMGISLASCDNFLDVPPKGQAQLEYTQDYLGLLEEALPNFNVFDSWFVANECSWYKTSDVLNYTWPMISSGFLWDESYDRASVMTESNLYNSCYQRITNYNAIISGVGDSKGSEADKSLALAQAKVLRAYNYFILINTFAKPYDPASADRTNGVIVREKMFESLEEKGVQQTVEYTYNFIQRDIEEALPDLPVMALNTFRPDRTFGYAFKAKVHLFKREYDKCLEACLMALDEARAAGHVLWDMNEPYNKFAPTLLRGYGTDRAIDEPRYMGINPNIENIWKNSVTRKYDDPENLYYQMGSTDTDPFPMYVTKDILRLFDDSDLRELFCIAYKTTLETAPQGDREFKSMGIKWNVGGMRLSEVYLMLAECYARKGTPSDIAKAMDYLDQLRSTRCIAKSYRRLQTSDAAEALRFVREERKRELFLTYNGFFDLRRFSTEFNESVSKEFEGRTYTLSPGSSLLTFPFPLNAMQTSDLKQNSK